MTTKRKAFTFIEVMVALTIVSIALIALIRLQLISIKLTEHTEITTQAVLLAEEKMTELMTDSLLSPGIVKGTVNRNGRKFQWHSEIENLPSNLQMTLQPIINYSLRSAYTPNLNKTTLPNNDLALLRRAQVTVNWFDSRTLKQIQLTSYLTMRNAL